MIKFDRINNGWILYTPSYRETGQQNVIEQCGFREVYYETLHCLIAAIKNHYSHQWKEEQKKIKARMQMGKN